MDKKYNTMEYNNAIACEVCGRLNFADDYGNSAKCPHCGWQQCGSNEMEEKWYGISYPMLVPLSRAREQYKSGKPFKATFEDFINGFNFYGEMLFWYNGRPYQVYGENNGVQLYSRGEETDYDTLDDFINNGSVEGKRLKDVWDEVVHPCFMYPVASDEDYEELPEDYGTV